MPRPKETHQIHRQLNLKFNRDECLFRCTNIPFFGEITTWQAVSPDPSTVQVLMAMPPLIKTKEALQSFLGILNYLSEEAFIYDCRGVIHYAS